MLRVIWKDQFVTRKHSSVIDKVLFVKQTHIAKVLFIFFAQFNLH